MSTSAVASAPPAWVLSGEGPRVEIWGLAAEERLRRSLERAGCSPVSIIEAKAPPEPPHAPSILVFRGDVVVDERLASALAARPDTLLATSDLGPIAGHVARARAAELVRVLQPDAPDSGLADAKRVDAAELAAAGMTSMEPLASRLEEARRLLRKLGAHPELERIRRLEVSAADSRDGASRPRPRSSGAPTPSAASGERLRRAPPTAPTIPVSSTHSDEPDREPSTTQRSLTSGSPEKVPEEA